MRKNVLIGLGGVFLVLIIFIWQVAANLDSIVAGVIEEVGSDVLQTKVTVAGVSINLKEGKAGITGMTVANPAGYSSANLFVLEGIEVDLDVQSMSQDVLVIKSIHIQNPQVVFEGDETGGSNMQTLLNNIESGLAQDNGASAGEASDDGAVKMIIDRFEFSGGQVKASSLLKPGEVIELQLPAIKLTGIGRAEGGVTADVVMQQVTTELVSVVIEAALKAEVNKAIEKKKKGFMDKLSEKLKGSG